MVCVVYLCNKHWYLGGWMMSTFEAQNSSYFESLLWRSPWCPSRSPTPGTSRAPSLQFSCFRKIMLQSCATMRLTDKRMHLAEPVFEPVLSNLITCASEREREREREKKEWSTFRSKELDLYNVDLVVTKNNWEVPDCQGFPFRTVGSIGKRERRIVRRRCDESYNLMSATSNRIEAKLPEARNEYSTRRDFCYASNKRVSVGNNVDSGLGESTPQDFSSCCSSSADSNKPIHVVCVHLCLHS
jgi:hypothetical protein